MGSMDSVEFTYWQEYDAHIEPIGEQPTRRLIAHMIALYLNSHSAKDARRFYAEDFMPWCEAPKREQSTGEMQQAVYAGTQTPLSP